EVWTPSLYLGGLTLVLALGAAGLSRECPRRRWLTAIAIVSLLAGLGKFTGPLYWARWSPRVATLAGPHDPHKPPPLRMDTALRDGDGSFYWTLATVLPGFKQFRYPSKLLTFTALAVAGLAGLGWDRLAASGSRRTTLLAVIGAAASIAALGAVWANRAAIVD